jgi:hypothetical protein
VSGDQQFILGLLTIAVAALGHVLVYRKANRAANQSTQANVKADALAIKTDELTANVNGKMAQLIDVTEKAAFGQGVHVGVAAGVASSKPESAVVPPIAVPELPAVAPTVPPSMRNRRKEDRERVNPPPPEHDPETHLT